MQALYKFFEEREKVGITEYRLVTKRQSNGDFKFYIETYAGDKLVFILTRVGLTPLDNRGILGADDL
jgi:hypothetical protein